MTTIETLLNEVWPARLTRSCQLTVRMNVSTLTYRISFVRTVGDRWEVVQAYLRADDVERARTHAEGFAGLLDHAIAHALSELRDLTVSEAIENAERRRLKYEDTQQATVIRGCYRILASAEPAAESLASIPFAKLDRVLLADALIRAGWRPPDAR